MEACYNAFERVGDSFARDPQDLIMAVLKFRDALGGVPDVVAADSLPSDCRREAEDAGKSLPCVVSA